MPSSTTTASAPALSPQRDSARALWLRWSIRGSMAGFGLSLCIHLAFLAVAAIWTISMGQAGGSNGDRDLGQGGVDMALMSDTQFGSAIASGGEAGLEVTTPSIADASQDPIDTPVILDGPASTSTGGTGISDGAGKLGEGITGSGGDIGGSAGLGEGGSGGGSGAAKFFGVEAVGSRFAYIVDISGSMQGVKLRQLKTELIESIGALQDHMQFYVIFFSTEAQPMDGRVKWTKSDDKGKTWMKESVNKLNAFGGTNPLPAFQLVFDVSPRPDAIYFMTDGLFDPEVATEVARMNKRGKRVAIHTIGFDIQDKAAQDLLQRIAEESGGRYTAVAPGAQK